MRRSALFVVGCALSLYLIGAVPAWADNGPHVKLGESPTPDRCAACHRAHTAQAPYLLKEKQESLCFTCHGSGGTGSSLDVEEGVGYAGHTRNQPEKAGALRGGGFEFALINTGSVTPVYEAKGRLESATIPPLGLNSGEATTSTHSIGVAGQTIWGNGATGLGKTGAELECGSCHDPHGNGDYRILKGKPDESNAPAEVNIPDVETGKEYKYTTTNYWQAWDVNDRNFRWKISEWCSTCHTRYLANKNAPMENLSGDPVFSYRHHTEYSQEEYETLEASSTKTKPNCIQCHVSHGSNAKMGTNSQLVPWPGGAARGADSSLLRLDNRGVCQTCHHK